MISSAAGPASRILIENIRIPLGAPDEEAYRIAAHRAAEAGGLGTLTHLHMHRKSIDARHKNAISFVCTVYAEAEASSLPDASRLSTFGIRADSREPLALPVGREPMNGRPVIVGFGPAGMFCALLLAECGFRPLVLERGGALEERVAAVDRFFHGGSLDPDTNIQFGAGGAGTFSDGKLTTRIGDARIRAVLERLCGLGAPEDILWRAKPHIGTDHLRRVVAGAQERITALGGEIRYHACASQVGDGTLRVGGERLPYGALVLACGHSARDLYAELLEGGFSIEAKPFSAGIRIEHLQSELDEAMYGASAAAYGLPHAEYALSCRRGERGVYSFCMCPGGEVVAAASEAGGVVTNGMSNYARSGKNANAALAVSVHPSDYDGTPAGAIEFQRALERAAFRAGGETFAAPYQTVGDFLTGARGSMPGRILPTYRGGDVRAADFHTLLPPFITSMLEEGLRQFGHKIRGFDAPDVPMTGIETRTSAPLRILRDTETLCAPGHAAIYPCGEGAGYAGGIMSAAVDGIRVAQAILARFARPQT